MSLESNNKSEAFSEGIPSNIFHENKQTEPMALKGLVEEARKQLSGLELKEFNDALAMIDVEYNKNIAELDELDMQSRFARLTEINQVYQSSVRALL